jgi:hypothetical protein
LTNLELPRGSVLPRGFLFHLHIWGQSKNFEHNPRDRFFPPVRLILRLVTLAAGLDQLRAFDIELLRAQACYLCVGDYVEPADWLTPRLRLLPGPGPDTGQFLDVPALQ